jgi:hypothetical protein
MQRLVWHTTKVLSVSLFSRYLSFLISLHLPLPLSSLPLLVFSHLTLHNSSSVLPSSCPNPFIRDSSKDPICAIPCENPFISPPTRVALDQLKMWLAFISLFVDLLVIVGVLTSKERRTVTFISYPSLLLCIPLITTQFPGNMIGFLTIPQMLVSGTFILGYMIGYKQIRCSTPLFLLPPSSPPPLLPLPFSLILSHCPYLSQRCKSKTEPSTQFDYGFCGFEGAIIYLGGSVLACYWLVLSFNLFLSTVFKVSFEKGRFSIWTIMSYHLFAWGLPLVGLISLLSLEKFGYERQDWW